MITTTFFPGRYIQGYGAISRLGPEIARLGKMGFLICSPTVYGKVLPTFKEEMVRHAKVAVEKFSGECSDPEIDRMLKLAQKASSDVVIGMGGGKVIDTAKAVAHKLGTPVMIVPTVATSDAPCSAVSVIYTPEGEMDRPMPHPRSPDVVLMDSKIIIEAPVRFLVAGMGDALSTWFEAETCQKRYAPNMTFTGDTGSMTGYALAWLCYQSLLKYGTTAKRACEARAVVPALEHIIETNTLLSGLGFESGGLAAPHGYQTGFTVLKETHHHLHGEVVAFGTQASLFLSDKSKEIIDEVYTFCESVGLPTTLAEIGLANLTEAQLTQVAAKMMEAENPVHNEPIPLSVDSIIAAIKAADYEGNYRKSKLK
jgi:glycerol dehydrogenase